MTSLSDVPAPDIAPDLWDRIESDDFVTAIRQFGVVAPSGEIDETVRPFADMQLVEIQVPLLARN